MNRLCRLLASNARRGSFRAEGSTIYIYDVIVDSDENARFMGGVSAETVVKTIRSMTGPITLRINSPGGDVFAARTIQAAMEAHDGEIVAHVDGYAASAASLIAVAADRCVMASGAFMMIHKAWTITLGNADDMLASATLLEKIDATLAETYAAKAGGEAGSFSDLMRAETWFTAQEAIDAGLADEITAKAPRSQAAWDLTAYRSAPASDQIEIEATPEPEPAEPAADPIAHRQRLHALRMRQNPA